MVTFALGVCLLMVEKSSSEPTKCTTMRHQNVEFCSMVRNMSCAGNGYISDICKKELKIGVIKTQTYDDVISLFVDDMMIPDCCRGCLNVKHINNYASQGKFANDSNLGKVEDDIVYPFLGKTDTLTISGWYFIPVIDISRITVVTNKKMPQEIILELITSSLKLWPLLSICMMMTVIAGFFMWILDTGMNTDEFPRGFIKGCFEGFWWAFISMTTVGYGDKSPRSYLARIFAISWILLGITIFSMFTASLTTILQSASREVPPVIYGKKIGVQQSSLMEDTFVLKRGGKIGARGDLETLIHMLGSRKIDAFVTDLLSSSYIIKTGTWTPTKWFTFHEVDLSEEKLSYGILVKNESVFDYFGSYCRDNQIFIQACIFNDIVREEIEDDDVVQDLFNSESKLFWHSFYATLGAIIFILIFGASYEFVRWKCKNKGETITSYKENRMALVDQLQAILDSHNKTNNNMNEKQKINENGTFNYFG